MGLGLFRSSSGPVSEGYTPRPGNPVPTNFKVLETEEINGNLIVLVHYPDAMNFEGVKIMLYRGMTAAGFKVLKAVDPHFAERGPAPFARFEPTEDGIWAAKQLAAQLAPLSKARRRFTRKLKRSLRGRQQ